MAKRKKKSVDEVLQAAGPDARTLQLDHRALTEVPDALRSFRALRNLDLSCNQLDALPSWLSELPLERLDLGGNPLTTIPDVVFDLARLEQLRARATRIRQLPAGLGALTRLRLLSISGVLEDASAAAECVTLSVLSFSDTPHLSALPDLVGLAALEQLWLEGSGVRTLPSLPQHLRELRAQLAMLESVAGLPASLQLLDLSGARSLRRLPDEMGHLTRLRELRLDDAPVASVPFDFDRLSSLEKLSLGRVRVGEGNAAFLSAAAQLPKLTSLAMDGTYPAHSDLVVPSAVFSAPALTFLSIAGWKVGQLPELSGEPAPLRKLLLPELGLSALPASFSRFSSLEHITLDDNALTEVPACLAELPALTHVRMVRNRVGSGVPAWASERGVLWAS